MRRAQSLGLGLFVLLAAVAFAATAQSATTVATIEVKGMV